MEEPEAVAEVAVVGEILVVVAAVKMALASELVGSASAEREVVDGLVRGVRMEGEQEVGMKMAVGEEK